MNAELMLFVVHFPLHKVTLIQFEIYWNEIVVEIYNILLLYKVLSFRICIGSFLIILFCKNEILHKSSKTIEW